MNRLLLFAYKLPLRIKHLYAYFELKVLQLQLGHLDKTAILQLPDSCTCPSKIYLYENTNIFEHAKFIISPIGAEGKFVMKRNSGSAEGLTIITGNHHRKIGVFVKELMRTKEADENKDIIVEEDVWIGANVTLLAGVKIGRGATIAAGAIVTKSIPPYAIAMGNPAKVIGFNYTPEEVIEHEKKIYSEEERIPLSKLEKNYDKYYLNRLDEISAIL
jgi:acetyltransferase-like isoleucine patch superfamily enzyme